MSSRRLKFFALSLLLFVISLPGLLYGQKISRLTVGLTGPEKEAIILGIGDQTSRFGP